MMRTLAVTTVRLVIAVAVVVVLLPVLLWATINRPVAHDIPEHLRLKRDMLAEAIEDARFVPPITIGAEAQVCSVGSFMPEASVCDVVGRATFPPDSDTRALALRLRARGWSDNGQIDEDEWKPFAWYRKVGGNDLCLDLDVRNRVMTVEIRSDKSCTFHPPHEDRRWAGWDLLLPDDVPARLSDRSRARTIRVGEDQAEVAVRFGEKGAGVPPLVEVRLRRLGASDAEQCYRDPDLDHLLAFPKGERCRLVRTTPGGHPIYLTPAVTGTGEQQKHVMIRRWWYTAIGQTVVAIEGLDGTPGRVVITDAEVDRLVDSLRPATYEEIRAGFAVSPFTMSPDERYDEPPCRTDPTSMQVCPN